MLLKKALALNYPFIAFFFINVPIIVCLIS